MSVDAFGFDERRQADARGLRVIRLRLFAVRVVAYAAIVAILIAGASRALSDAVRGLAGDSGSTVAYVAVLYGILFAANLPFAAYSGLVLERRFSLSRETARSWLLRDAKAAALGLAFSLPAVVILLYLLRNLGELWWIAAWLLSAAASFLFAYVAPTVIAPLFYRFEPLRDPELRDRVESLGRRARVDVHGVYTMDASRRTSRSNAAVIGLGRTRRIVLADNLLASFDPDETETVVAHELAHVAHRDAVRFQALGLAMSFVVWATAGLLHPVLAPALGFRPAELAALPILGGILAVAAGIVGPILNAISRGAESRADAFAVAITGKRDAFASALVKLHDANLGDANPGRLYEAALMSHPSGRRRVERLRTSSKAVK